MADERNEAGCAEHDRFGACPACLRLERVDAAILKEFTMSRQVNESFGLSRRSFVIASVVGTLAGGVVCPIDGVATEPQGAGSTSVTAKTAVERIAGVVETHQIRLKPISRDFDSIIVQAIASDPQGELIAVAGDDHAIRIFDARSLELIVALEGHSDLIQTLDFDSTGDQLVSAGNDGLMIIWKRNEASEGNERFVVSKKMPTPLAWACVRFSPDRLELAAVGFDNTVYLIGKSRQKGNAQASCECTDLRAVGYRGDGRLLAVAGRSGDLHLFDRKTAALLDEVQIHAGRIHDLKFTKSSPVVVSAGEDGCVVMYDTEARQVVKRINVTTSKLFSVCILDRRHIAVAGSDNVIRIVEATDGVTVETLTAHTGSISALASTGTALFSGGYDATLRRWDLSGLQGGRERIAERDIPIDR